jgi:3-deoxy-D-manno-octulosonic-acid transferase
MLKRLNHIFVQDTPSVELLKDIGISSVTVCGDTRVDRVAAITKETLPNNKVERFVKDSEVFIIGSSWPEDVEILAGLINSEHDIKFIIAPHEVTESQINWLESVIKRPTARYSTFHGSNPEVLLVDTIGILSHLYRYGKYAYIGGAFGKGLHNILEAATFGLPLFFGNGNYQKFAEAKALVASGGAFAVSNSEELGQVYFNLKENRSKWQAAQQACLRYIRENTGATEIIISYMKTRIAS